MEVLDYDLPESAIAQTPAEPRDSARLLVALDPGGALEHRSVRDLPELLGPGDVVVLNDSRVIPARLSLRKATGGAAEVLLLEPLSAAGSPAAGAPAGGPAAPEEWLALVRPGRRLHEGTVLYQGDRPVLQVGERVGSDRRRVRLLAAEPPLAPGSGGRSASRRSERLSGGEFGDFLEEIGTVALPPYIHKSLADPERYQTVYARHPGSVAAPTAGLHLTTEVLARCHERGAEIHALDLSVGLGTFRPISGGSIEDHVMHAESYRVPEETMEACRRAGRVVAIGTTTVRALETAAATGVLEGRSELYIHGDYQFALVDVLLTNFHQPRSTLLVLLEAFCGGRWREIYAQALAEGYRFLSFGDAMIVGRRR